MDVVDDRNKANDLAIKTAQLNDKQQQQYQHRVNLAMEANGRVSDKYRLDVVNTLLQPIREYEQGRQIKEADRREQQRVTSDQQREEHTHANAVTRLASKPVSPAQDGGNPQPSLDSPMAATQSRDSPQRYDELKRTHEQVAAKQDAERSATIESASMRLSKERLQNMAERYAEVRKAENLEPTPSELRERDDLAKMHADDRERIGRGGDPDPSGQQKQQRSMLDHQHLAERVGVEARWIGQMQKERGTPDAPSYEQDARRAHQTARLVHEQRHRLGAREDHTQDTARVIQQQEQQNQADVREAVRGGRTLTSEQQENAPPEFRQAIDRKDRTDATPETAKQENLTGRARLTAALNAAKESANGNGQSRDPGRSL